MDTSFPLATLAVDGGGGWEGNEVGSASGLAALASSSSIGWMRWIRGETPLLVAHLIPQNPGLLFI